MISSMEWNLNIFPEKIIFMSIFHDIECWGKEYEESLCEEHKRSCVMHKNFGSDRGAAADQH